MATYRGSGKFVGIMAGSRIFYEDDIKGVFFGYKPNQNSGDNIYCTIAPKYNTGSGGSITLNSLEVASGWTLPDAYDVSYREPLYLSGANLSRILVDGWITYTGSHRVASSVTVNSSYMATTNYTTYYFQCGLLYSGI